ncbi:uncharacterized protein [Diabrotica undecimpunctata]|uniref:uncharacterized protein n=1 Tax=Diabrotica undecimpunctata TaxID=50387 RepID=UPI003B636ED4
MFGGDETDEDYVEEQLSDSNSEQSDNEDEIVDEAVRNIPSLLGKNGHRWSTQAPARQGRTRRKNIVIHLPGPKGEASTVQSPEQSWNLLFNEQIIDVIVLHSNEEVIRKCNDIRQQSYTRPATRTEVKAFIGLLFLAGALRVSNCNLDDLWSVKFGNGVFRRRCHSSDSNL